MAKGYTQRYHRVLGLAARGLDDTEKEQASVAFSLYRQGFGMPEAELEQRFPEALDLARSAVCLFQRCARALEKDDVDAYTKLHSSYLSVIREYSTTKARICRDARAVSEAEAEPKPSLSDLLEERFKDAIERHAARTPVVEGSDNG